MYEAPEDIQCLQALLNQSIEQAGAFVREAFQMLQYSLSTRQLVFARYPDRFSE